MIVAAVDPRARAGIHAPRRSAIDRKAHHVGIIDHAVIDGAPGPSSMGVLPGKVKRSRIDRPRVARTYGQRIEVAQFLVVLGLGAFPGFPGVTRAMHALQRSGYDRVCVGRSHGGCAHGLAVKP